MLAIKDEYVVRRTTVDIMCFTTTLYFPFKEKIIFIFIFIYRYKKYKELEKQITGC